MTKSKNKPTLSHNAKIFGILIVSLLAVMMFMIIEGNRLSSIISHRIEQEFKHPDCEVANC